MTVILTASSHLNVRYVTCSSGTDCHAESPPGRVQRFKVATITGKNNGFPFLDILGYLKNTQKNPKFGRVRQVPIRELGWEFPTWDLSHFAKFGIFMGIL